MFYDVYQKRYDDRCTSLQDTIVIFKGFETIYMNRVKCHFVHSMKLISVHKKNFDNKVFFVSYSYQCNENGISKQLLTKCFIFTHIS